MKLEEPRKYWYKFHECSSNQCQPKMKMKSPNGYSCIIDAMRLVKSIYDDYYRDQ